MHGDRAQSLGLKGPKISLSLTGPRFQDTWANLLQKHIEVYLEKFSHSYLEGGLIGRGSDRKISQVA